MKWPLLLSLLIEILGMKPFLQSFLSSRPLVLQYRVGHAVDWVSIKDEFTSWKSLERKTKPLHHVYRGWVLWTRAHYYLEVAELLEGVAHQQVEQLCSSRRPLEKVAEEPTANLHLFVPSIETSNTADADVLSWGIYFRNHKVDPWFVVFFL